MVSHAFGSVGGSVSEYIKKKDGGLRQRSLRFLPGVYISLSFLCTIRFPFQGDNDGGSKDKGKDTHSIAL